MYTNKKIYNKKILAIRYAVVMKMKDSFYFLFFWVIGEKLKKLINNGILKKEKSSKREQFIDHIKTKRKKKYA